MIRIGEWASLCLPYLIYDLHDLVVAIQKGPVDGVLGNVTDGPRCNLIIPQNMFAVESCLRNGMQLLPYAVCCWHWVEGRTEVNGRATSS